MAEVPPGATPAPATQNVIDALFRLPLLRETPDAVEPLLRRGVELLLLVLLYLVGRSIIARLVNQAASAVAAREAAAGNLGRAARVRTLGSLIKSILFYTLAFIVIVAALGTVGLDLRAVLGTAGVAGLAVGFGAQKLVKDVISGFFLLLEDQYAVGDYVTIGAVTGTVEELGMRITRIRDDDGRLYILANGDINQVCNQSRGPVGGAFEIAIGASADSAQAMETLDAALARLSEELALAEPARVEGIVQTDAAKTVLRVRFRTAPNQRAGAVTFRLRQAARDALLAGEIPLA